MKGRLTLHRLRVERDFLPFVGQAQGRVVQFLSGIEMARIQVTAPVESPMVGHMDDPRSRCRLGAIEKSSFAEDEQKDFLHQIVRLGLVPQNPVGNIAHGTSIAAEKNAERVFGPLPNLFQEQFV